MFKKLALFFKKIIQLVLDFLFPTTNFTVSTGDVLVTKNHKLFNVKEV